MKNAHLLLVLALGSCALPATGGRDLWVTPGEGGEWDDATQVDHALTFTTIQDAINAASAGDTVNVPAGTYYENLVMAEGVDVDGAGQEETYLVGTVYFDGLTDAALSGMALVDPGWVSSSTPYTTTYGVGVNSGAASLSDLGIYYYQYGIQVGAGTTVSIDGNTLARNWYAMLITSVTDLTISNNLVANNPAGGIALAGNTGNIVHNTVVGNAFSGTAAYLTGAIGMQGSGAEVVANNILTSNYYGLNCYGCSGSWESNLVWGNTTDYVNDASADFSDIAGDPLFVASSEGNYHLTAASPAVDAGDLLYGVATDIDGELRPQGVGIDVGYDEFGVSAYSLVVTEVMANARTESTGEFIEIYNAGSAAVDLAGLVVTDGDDIDVLEAFSGGVTTLDAGAYAVVVDPEYPGTYGIDSAVTVVTTGDTTLGNGLTTSDKITLYETDGSTVIATFSYPTDPGDGVSLELYDLETGDAAGNWRVSQCASGYSPGAAHCFPESGDQADLIITEVMANPATEASGEYVEIYNPTTTDIDCAGLIIEDDDGSSDSLLGYQGGSTLLGPNQHALILDPDYAYDYYLPTDIVLLTTPDSTIANALATTDTLVLYTSDGSTVVDSYSYASDPGDSYSREKVDYAAGDVSTNWVDADTGCSRGRSPGRLNGAAGGICAPIMINEVMANADDEDTGEFIELYNGGGTDIDLAGLMITDGDEWDTLAAYDGGSTVLPAGGYALVLDAEYDGDYTLDASTILVTTGDTTLGNALSVNDPIELYEADGLHLIDAFGYPSNPGNAVSIERVAMGGGLDSDANWEPSSCASGSSPGLDNCVSASSGGPAVSTLYGSLLITEIMSNALTESTGEFVELYNAGSTDIDLLYYVLYDGDAVDTIFGFTDVYDTVLGAGEYAVILDADYAGEYTIPSGTLLLVTDDSTIGSGLAVNDPIYLFESNAISLIDSYTFPFDAGNGISVEKVDTAAGDTTDNWEASECSGGSSPGAAACF
ncbi:MAG: lamin tail domain-containing protein [Pseudomonadota bacterium]